MRLNAALAALSLLLALPLLELGIRATGYSAHAINIGWTADKPLSNRHWVRHAS